MASSLLFFVGLLKKLPAVFFLGVVFLAHTHTQSKSVLLLWAGYGSSRQSFSPNQKYFCFLETAERMRVLF
jgi:hypothetical protein